ncbi:MAG: RING-HC finger protein [Rhodothermaceae bacterium TMED105]|nr:MAG: RING-HC finger protein [Rhodothermaceae bacterium TMED105]
MGACTSNPKIAPSFKYPETRKHDIEFISARCVVCFHAPLELCCIPCGHFCLCESCHKSMKNHSQTFCPICKGSVSNVQKIYVPTSTRHCISVSEEHLSKTI